MPGTSLCQDIYKSFLFPTHYWICLNVKAATGLQIRLPIKLSFGKQKTKNTRNVISRNIEVRSRNHYCRGKAISIIRILSVCVCVCLCILSHPTFIAQAPYFLLWPVCIYHIFPRYLINGTTSRTKVIQYHTCISLFSTTSVWNISHSKKNSATYYHKFT